MTIFDKDMMGIWIMAFVILGDILIPIEKPKYTKIIGYFLILISIVLIFIALTSIALEQLGYLLE